MEYTILICDDDEDIMKALEIYISCEKYHVLKAQNGRQALELMKQNEVHLVLLDVMMPVLDGIATATIIRETSNVPIIFLSAKSEDTDKILGLHVGADDYVTKPFNPVELLARIHANLRRYANLGSLKKMPSKEQGIFQTGGLELDNNKKMVCVEGKEVSLTAIEYNILLFLMQNMNHVFSSNQIYAHVWNEPAFDVSKTISVHIRHIREKIEINPKEPKYIKVVYGLGYKVVQQ